MTDCKLLIPISVAQLIGSYFAIRRILLNEGKLIVIARKENHPPANISKFEFQFFSRRIFSGSQNANSKENVQAENANCAISWGINRNGARNESQ